MRSFFTASILAINADASQEFTHGEYRNSVADQGPSPYYWPHQGIDDYQGFDKNYAYDSHDARHYDQTHHYRSHHEGPHHRDHYQDWHGYEEPWHGERHHYSNNMTHHEHHPGIHPHIKPSAPHGYSDNQVIWDNSFETWAVNGDEFNPD